MRIPAATPASAYRRFKTLLSGIQKSLFPPVRVLIPPEAVEQENLESWFQLRYPHLELIIGILPEDQETFRELSRLQAQYPHLRVEIIRTSGEYRSSDLSDL